MSKKKLIFDTTNYRWWLCSIVVVVLGYVLMYGTENIYDFRKIVLAPIVVLVGYAICFIAIFKRVNHKKK